MLKKEFSEIKFEALKVLIGFLTTYLHDKRRFFVDSSNSAGAKLLCEVWLNLMILSQSGILKFFQV